MLPGSDTFQTPARQAAPSPGPDRPVIQVIKDLVQHARGKDMALADEALTDILGRLHGWPVEAIDGLP
jgi:hypothetical protein